VTLSKLNADKPEMTPAPSRSQTIEWDDFMRVDLRVGTIVSVEDFPEARRPAYKLQVDFGAEIGLKKSSAQITDLYNRESLLGRQVLAVVNFPPKQIGPFMSECLVTGFHNAEGAVVLTMPTAAVPNGSRLI
jgi:tRNA-binding protein